MPDTAFTNFIYLSASDNGVRLTWTSTYPDTVDLPVTDVANDGNVDSADYWFFKQHSI